MGSYWSVEECAWVEYDPRLAVAPEQRPPSDDDAAQPAAEELLAQHLG